MNKKEQRRQKLRAYIGAFIGFMIGNALGLFARRFVFYNANNFKSIKHKSRPS